MEILEIIGLGFIEEPAFLGVYVAISVVLLPIISTVLDRLTSFISYVSLKINTLVVDKIPVKFIRDMAQKKQVESLEKIIEKYKKTISEIIKK